MTVKESILRSLEEIKRLANYLEVYNHIKQSDCRTYYQLAEKELTEFEMNSYLMDGN